MNISNVCKFVKYMKTRRIWSLDNDSVKLELKSIGSFRNTNNGKTLENVKHVSIWDLRGMLGILCLKKGREYEKLRVNSNNWIFRKSRVDVARDIEGSKEH